MLTQKPIEKRPLALYRLLTTLFCLSFTLLSQQIPAAEVSGTASATVVRPCLLYETQSLNFGAFYFDPYGGEISADHQIIRGNLESETPGAAAVWEFNGPPLEHYRIELNKDVRLNGPGKAMSAYLEPTPYHGQTDSDGKGRFSVSGILRVPDGQSPGDYTGTYEIEVRY